MTPSFWDEEKIPWLLVVVVSPEAQQRKLENA